MSLPNIKSDLFLVKKWLWQAMFGKNVAEQKHWNCKANMAFFQGLVSVT